MDCAKFWIDKLNLVPHPGLETGYMSKNVFEDNFQVKGTTGESRQAWSNIYFLHQPAPEFNEDTVFFRMVNYELLNFYRGHPVTVCVMPDPKSVEIQKVVLGPDVNKGQQFFYPIPRNCWFVRRLESEDSDAFALLGCTVVPGYNNKDIETKTFKEIRIEIENETRPQ